MLTHRVALVGATGVVGSRVVPRLCERADVASVIALGRRVPSFAHAKLDARVAALQDPDALQRELRDGVDLAVCCLGTTMKQAGSKEAFRAVDYDAVLAFGRAARACGAVRFVLVSSVGADARSGNFYLKTKGEAEDALATLGYAQLTVLRPSFIDNQGARTEFRPGERFVLPLARAVFTLIGRSDRKSTRLNSSH